MPAKPSAFTHQSMGVAAERQDRALSGVLKIFGDTLFVSEVVDNVTHFGTVKVNAANGTTIQGVSLTHAGNGVIGPRKIGSAFPAHTKVLCYKPRGVNNFCYVLGSIPNWHSSALNNYVPDWIVPGCRSGIAFDRVHSAGVVERPNGPSGDINFSSGAPADELPGDHGYINDMGVSYGIGRAMAWLRASHFCGIEAFWFDNLLRLTGMNMEIHTAASDMRSLSDEGEWNEMLRWSPYPWETRGVYSHETDFTKHGGDNWDAGRAGREPQFDDQAGIYRVQRFRGYLGDVERTIVALPQEELASAGGGLEGGTEDTPESTGGSSGGVQRMETKSVFPGLLDVGFGVCGDYHIRSAKSILLEKTVTLPVPKELIAPDDATGDTPENYKAAGIWGDGDEHTRTEPEFNDVPGARALLAWERHSLLYGYYANLGFVKHKKDWYLPEETDSIAAFGFDKGLYEPDTTLSPTTFWMPPPKKVELDVDHRGKCNYYAGRAFFEIGDDGSILMEDAFGSQIRMEGGNIFIAARNDVVLQPGRNVQAWAPHDLVLKSGNSTDISCSKGDMRLKAEGNLMMLANTKGVLIESAFDPAEDGLETPDWTEIGESIESRGVLIKALRSDVISMSQDVYIRAGAREETAAGSQLHIDAGDDKGELFLHGREVTSRAQDRVQMIVGSTGENDTTTSFDLKIDELVIGGQVLQNVNIGSPNISFGHELYDAAAVNVHGNLFVRGVTRTADRAEIGGRLDVNGPILSQGALVIRGAGVFTGGLIYNVKANSASVPLPATADGDFDLPGDHPETAKEQTDADVERFRQALIDARVDDNAQVLELEKVLYGDDSKFASDDLINNAVFSFRTPEEYGTKDEFIWYEARWQEMNRKLFDLSDVWVEVAVEAPGRGEQTMPYPGHRIWEEEEALVTLGSNKLFDFSTGTAIARADMADDATLAETKPVKFKDGYNVTLQTMP